MSAISTEKTNISYFQFSWDFATKIVEFSENGFRKVGKKLDGDLYVRKIPFYLRVRTNTAEYICRKSGNMTEVHVTGRRPRTAMTAAIWSLQKEATSPVTATKMTRAPHESFLAPIAWRTGRERTTVIYVGTNFIHHQLIQNYENHHHINFRQLALDCIKTNFSN